MKKNINTVNKLVKCFQSIAAYAYGDSGLWFVIAKANKILNPFKEVKDGDLILIPHSYGI